MGARAHTRTHAPTLHSDSPHLVYLFKPIRCSTKDLFVLQRLGHAWQTPFKGFETACWPTLVSPPQLLPTPHHTTPHHTTPPPSHPHHTTPHHTTPHHTPLTHTTPHHTTPHHSTAQ